MDLCWRWPSIIALVALAGHATNWFGAVHPAAGGPGPAAQIGGLLSGADSLVNQIFAWLFLLIALEVVLAVATYLIGEVKLRRLYDRPDRRWSATPIGPLAAPSSAAPSDPSAVAPFAPPSSGLGSTTPPRPRDPRNPVYRPPLSRPPL